jgi:hypothetical protein
MVEFGSGLNELSMVKSATSADPVESTFRFAAEIDLPKIKQNKTSKVYFQEGRGRDCAELRVDKKIYRRGGTAEQDEEEPFWPAKVTRR